MASHGVLATELQFLREQLKHIDQVWGGGGSIVCTIHTFTRLGGGGHIDEVWAHASVPACLPVPVRLQVRLVPLPVPVRLQVR